ncbi:hypothetical protein [Mucilaginibacter gotjawali]|uniref:Ca2+/H+ antiporter n=1 Tax=Mucilaginibacter gotjawali TaxID=1550579 RepID=A0A839SP01_9SPHI|nr:hypothetical protein [Mucilaginibacter gotjawali]MBB3058934.1 Ca2+/H+ antiporter [Mucilaginibacter gotjawali]
MMEENNMFSKNSYLAGALIALVFPAISLVAAYLLKDSMLLFNKPALPYLVAIVLNLIIMRLLSKKETVKTVKGIMIVTFIFIIVLFILKQHLFR